MNFVTQKKPAKTVRALLLVIKPYSASWHEWIESGACFLNPKEIMIINNYLVTGSHHGASIELGITEGAASSILRKAKRRLQWGYPKYQQWLTEILLENHEIITYESEQDKFLNSPLSFLSIPNPLKAKFSLLAENTMNEILTNYSEKDLYRFRSFGKKNMEEFKNVLKGNNCLQFLK